MTESEVVEIMHGLAQRYGCTGLEPGEFTCRMFAQANGLKIGAAQSAIDRGLADGGIIFVARRKVGPRLVKAYRKVA